MENSIGTRTSWFERPERVLAVFAGFSMLVWTLQCSLLQKVIGIDIFETIVWGEQLQWGHSKHPPLSGWIGYFFAWVTGHSDWGLYLAAQVCISSGVFFTFKLARLFFDRFRAVTAALLPYFLVYYTPSEMKFSTYFVEMAVAPAASYLFIRSLRENRWHLWLVLGAVGGLGMLNKYSFALVLAGFAVTVLTRAEYRRRLASLGPYLAALVMMLVFLPHIKWLVEHDFVCFRHVEDRLDEKPILMMPLYILLIAIYPVAAEAAALLLSGFRRSGGGWAAWTREMFRSFRGGERTPNDREALHFSAIVTILPGTVYLLLSLFGTDIILMWLCSTASASGIMVLALFPVEIDRARFKRISVLLAIFIGIVLIATTADLMFRTSARIHLEPSAVLNEVDAFWREHSASPIRVVVGGLRYAALVDHYSPGHPPVCEPDDDVMIDLYRARIREHGALLIDRSEKDFTEFLKRAGVQVKLESRRVFCRSLFGRERSTGFVMGFLPPGTDIR